MACVPRTYAPESRCVEGGSVTGGLEVVVAVEVMAVVCGGLACHLRVLYYWGLVL